MKFGVAFANIGPFIEPEEAVFLARACEEAGIESLWTVEHVAVPSGYQAQYPYSPDGKMPGPEDAPIPDPLIWLAYVAGATQKIQLATGILILPQRHPIYVAKEVATLDRLSGGRMVLGIGIGWLEEEFRSLGIPFDERVGRTEEACAALRSLWKPGAHAFKGEHFHWDALESNPKPARPGGVPIVVGGHVKGAARRAARVGDGFFPLKADGPRLGELLGVMGEECARVGRDPAGIEITTSLPGPDLDAIRRLEDQGVSRLVMGPPGFDRDAVRKGLDSFADAVMNKL
ncbi:MAG: LLM class F420-dependent oxidoreductase [Proteobacteria bacterium]|nr:LLM class F420-dependent oxidoreductase [Pseudomonadota bacterium]